MYLPTTSTLLGLFQLPLPLSGSDQPASLSVVPDEVFGHRRDYDLGALTPYHDAPHFHGVSSDLPGDCTVNQVILLHRHGSRGPTTSLEEDYIRKLVATVGEAKGAIQDVDLPPEFEFLKDGYDYQLISDQLTPVGREQLFNHGVDFALRYPTDPFWTDLIMSTKSERVVDSAHFFAQGLFGRAVDEIKISTPEDCEECDDPVSWLDTWKYCPNIPFGQAFEVSSEWAKVYIPPIVDRLNERIDVGFDLFSFDDVRGALYACAYDLATRKVSPWCSVFKADELRDFNYELDLAYDHITGHEGDPGPLVGAIYINKLIERLTDDTENAKPLYLEFGHDFTILPVLAAMALNKDDEPLGSDRVDPHRKFRTSWQTPFAAEMIWEKFTCETPSKKPQVRLRLNGETFPLSFCQESENDKTYGTCSLDAFVQGNAFSMGVKYQDDLWNERCGVSKSL